MFLEHGFSCVVAAGLTSGHRLSRIRMHMNSRFSRAHKHMHDCCQWEPMTSLYSLSFNLGGLLPQLVFLARDTESVWVGWCLLASCIKEPPSLQWSQADAAPLHTQLSSTEIFLAGSIPLYLLNSVPWTSDGSSERPEIICASASIATIRVLQRKAAMKMW